MFTGIVEEMGELAGISRGEKSSRLKIKASKVLENTKIGDSIAVNGVCLTVTKLYSDLFEADVMAETLRRSALGQLKQGEKVNLERAMAADGRFGGHIVSGHIDGTGMVTAIQKEDTAIWYTIQTEEKLLRYIVEKGSITIDGISLTVAKVTDEIFQVSIIPHTQTVTTLSIRENGDVVNLECDVIGKYVEKLLRPKEEKESNITENFLMEHGFLS